jgi:dihydroorotate dehydrogenase (NAD+) catalytic subunit
MLNAVGLQNPGVEAVIAQELPALAKIFHKPVMANVSGFSIDEYAETCAMLDAQPQVGWLEVNISCPNVHGGGMSFGADPQAAAAVTRAVKAVTKKPVIMKLSPNVTDIVSIARACEEAGADGLSLINTLLGMRIDLKRKKPLLANTTGGLSGGAVFPVAVRMVYQVYEAVSIPIVGMGGVSSARDVIEMMLAGATAVGVGAANLTEPYASRDIVEALPAVMEEYGISSLQEIIGGAH